LLKVVKIIEITITLKFPEKIWGGEATVIRGGQKNGSLVTIYFGPMDGEDKKSSLCPLKAQ